MANFDFEKYNEVMKTAGAGLKLHLISQLTADVLQTCIRFDNPILGDIMKLNKDVASIRKDWNVQAAAAKAERAATEKAAPPIVVNEKEGIAIS